MELTRLKGFRDLTGSQVRNFAYVEERARMLMERYAVSEIRIPLLERIDLYQRSTGETSDIVTKQMYTFVDHDEAETLVALRPEGTPGVVRAYIEAGMDRSDPEQRFYYVGPMFRRERPQKGRYRQFYQFGVEVFGRADAACDAELLIMIDDLRRELGLDLRFELNSLGHAECRPAFRAAVLEWGRAHLSELCGDCHERLERNPLRLLDCKIDAKLAESAPRSLDFLCPECRKHFDTVLTLLEGAEVPFLVNPRIVRGLDYYMRTTFEITSDALGSQNTVVAGGRYDGLVEALGGAAVPGIGFAIGLDRMALVLETAAAARTQTRRVALIALGEAATRRAVTVARELRKLPIQLDLLSPDRSLKSQLKRADRMGASHAVILGEDELARSVVQVRDLAASTQREVSIDQLAATFDPNRNHQSGPRP